MKEKHVQSSFVAANLEELRRRDHLELLRKPLQDYGIIVAVDHESKDGALTVDSLKKLVRRWKLHERRGFWKLNNTKEQLVEVLIDHMATHPVYENYVRGDKQGSKPHTPSSPPKSRKPFRHWRPTSDATSKIIVRPQLTNLFGHSSSTPFLTQCRYSTESTNIARIADFVKAWRNGVEFSHSTTDNQTVHNVDDRPSQMLVKQRRIAHQLMKLSFSAEGLENLIDDFCIAKIIEIANSGDETTVRAAIFTLANIAARDTAHSALYSADLLMTLPRISQHCRDRLTKRAFLLITFHLSCDNDSEDRIFSTVGSFLQDCASACDDKELNQICLLTLHNILPCLERHTVVEAIFKCISNINYRNMQRGVELVSTILSNITSYASVHFQVIELGIVELLLKLIDNTLGTGDKCVSNIAQCVANFMATSDAYVVLLSHPLVELLRHIAERNIPEANRLTALAVSQFTIHADTAKHIVQSSGCELFKTLVHADLKPSILAAVVAGIANLTIAYGTAHSSVVSFRLFENVMEVLKSPCTDSTTQLVTFTALCNLLATARTNDGMGAQLVRVLPQYLSSEYSIEIRLITAKSLYNIFGRTAAANELLNMDILMQLIATVKEQEPNLLPVTIKIFIELADQEACAVRLIEAGLIDIILQQEVMGTTVCLSYVQLVMRMAQFPSSFENRLPALLHFISETLTLQPSPEVLTSCATLLCMFSTDSRNLDQLLPFIPRLAKIANDAELLKLCAITVFNLSCLAKDLRDLSKDDFVLKTLVGMMRSSDIEVQKYAAATLCIMCNSMNSVKYLLQEHILNDFMVTAILRTYDVEVKELCAKALYNMLSFDALRPALLAADVLWAVIKLSKTAEPSIQAIGSQVVLNFTSEDELLEVLRRHNVFNSLLQLVDNEADAPSTVLAATCNLLNNSLRSDELLICYRIIRKVIVLIRDGGDKKEQQEKEEGMLDDALNALGYTLKLLLLNDRANYLRCVKEGILNTLLIAASIFCTLHIRSLLASLLNNICSQREIFGIVTPSELVDALAVLCMPLQEPLAEDLAENLINVFQVVTQLETEWVVTLSTSKFAWKFLKLVVMQFPPDHHILPACSAVIVACLAAEQPKGVRRHAACFELLTRQAATTINTDNHLYIIGEMSNQPDLVEELLESNVLSVLLGLIPDICQNSPRIVALSRIIRNFALNQYGRRILASNSSTQSLLQCLQHMATKAILEDCATILYWLGPMSKSTSAVTPELVVAFAEQMLATTDDETHILMCKVVISRTIQAVGVDVASGKAMVTAILTDIRTESELVESLFASVNAQPRAFIQITQKFIPNLNEFYVPSTSPTSWSPFTLCYQPHRISLPPNETQGPYTTDQLFKIRIPESRTWTKYHHNFETRVPITIVETAKHLLNSTSTAAIANFQSMLQSNTIIDEFPDAIGIGEPVCVKLGRRLDDLKMHKAFQHVSDQFFAIMTEMVDSVPAGIAVSVPSTVVITEKLAKVPVTTQCAVSRHSDGNLIVCILLGCSSATELMFECYGEREIVITDVTKTEIIFHASVVICPSLSKCWAPLFRVVDAETKAFIANATVSWSGPTIGMSSGDGNIEVDDGTLPEGVYAIKCSSPDHSLFARKFIKYHHTFDTSGCVVVELQRRPSGDSPIVHHQAARRNSQRRQSRTSSIRKSSISTMGKNA